MPQQGKEDDDRDRHAEQPEQNAATHDGLLGGHARGWTRSDDCLTSGDGFGSRPLCTTCSRLAQTARSGPPPGGAAGRLPYRRGGDHAGTLMKAIAPTGMIGVGQHALRPLNGGAGNWFHRVRWLADGTGRPMELVGQWNWIGCPCVHLLRRPNARPLEADSRLARRAR